MKKILGIAFAILVMCSMGSLVQAQTTTSCYIFNVNLGVGSTGPAVVSLQTFLIENKFSLPSITSGQKAKGTYDEETAAAVVQYQMSKGLPLTGYVGPLTRASLNARCSSTGTSATYPGKVNIITRLGGWPVSSGGTCVSTLSGPSGSNTAGCVRTLTNQPAGTYTLKWNNGHPAGADTTKAPTVSPVRFLGDRPAGENPITFYLDFASSTGPVATTTPMVSIVSRLDGRVLSANEIPVTCNVSLSTPKGIFPGPCSRTVQSSGAGTYAIRWYGSFPTGADTTKRPTVTSAQILSTSNLTFYVDFVSASGVSLGVSTDASSPDASIVIVDDVADTDNVMLLVGKLKVDGTSSVTINQLPITLSAAGASNVSAITGTVKLTVNNVEHVKSVYSSSAATTVIFDGLNINIAGGSTVVFKVSASINDIEPGSFDEGDMLTASLTAANRDAIGAKVSGVQLPLAQRTGIATGQPQEFRLSGIGVTFVSASTVVNSGTGANDDIGTFQIKYKVTANGGDVYIPSATNMAVNYVVDRAGVPVAASAISAVITNDTDSTKTSAGNFVIEEGVSETFTLTVNVQLGGTYTAGQYRMSLTGIKWGTVDDSTPDSVYTNLAGFATSYIGLNLNDIIDPMRRPTLTAALIDTFKAYFFGY